MIEIHINKDVGSYEAKFVGPFTMRQTICLVIAAPICWLIWKVASPRVSGDVAGFMIAIPAAIAWLFGWTKPYGMRPEKFVRSVFINMMLAPSHRRYKTTNNPEEFSEPIEQKDSEPADDETEKPKKQRKPRYKVSPDAVK